ncbi:Poly-beta-1,6-N-acetyl-D-glucosamine synthase [compost metagenome]
MKVACIVPTYNGRNDFLRLIGSLARQTAEMDVFIVDSSSTDGTQEASVEHGLNLKVISGAEFNHGGTRQMMVDVNASYDVYVFLTQDAFLENPDAITNLVKPFADPAVGAVCGRQLGHLDATLLANHARSFNYPDRSRVKSLSDAAELGIKTPFMSNSFSAYRGDALRDAGGFPSHVILSEDMYVAARMLLKGWKVAYASEAVCRHSHNYTIKEEFCRYFDQGVFHAREPWIREAFGGAGGEGLRYVKSELCFLSFKHLYLWPEAFVRNAFKLLAFKLGLRERSLSPALKKKLSMHKRYWDTWA